MAPMDSERQQRPAVLRNHSHSTPSLPSSSRHHSKRHKNRKGKKKGAHRRRSFVSPLDEVGETDSGTHPDPGVYAVAGRNLSNTSLESDQLLDHRAQQPFLRPRRPSMLATSTSYPAARSRGFGREDNEEEANERAPLLTEPTFQRRESVAGYGSNDTALGVDPEHRSRRNSNRSDSLRRRVLTDSYNVNYPPSVPGSPPLNPTDPMSLSFGDVLLRDELHHDDHSEHEDEGEQVQSPLERRPTILQAQEDVCFPQEALYEEERGATNHARPRRRRGKWPDLSILEEWSRFEKEGRSEERRAKKITEPQLINGRLRPVNRGWFQAEEEAPYRFTYFNEEFPSTIHSQTISELVQPGGTFRELFIPEPRIIEDSEDDDEQEDEEVDLYKVLSGQGGDSVLPSRQPSTATEGQPATQMPSNSESTKCSSDETTPPQRKTPSPAQADKPLKPVKYGDRPVWWLDILSPTEAEMKILSKAFGIHPLTAEDIMMQEQREKVELFRNYYFVSYRTFDQDQTSENFMEPINMYVVVFREGVLSFHFSVTPHPANVRRRIRQLSDYLILSSDWISYAIIDDITDVFVPLIERIECEVDEIDEAILEMHPDEDADGRASKYEKRQQADDKERGGRDMLRRVGDCRKKVMSLLRLLSTKADVIKGFAKRCNEHWEVAPRSEIGLYLGDIQDHIVTMTSNLSHYEKILARSHTNYLAQINIRMTERQEQTADVLGKLTVLGTIVLPMNIITGLWGMNVWVPGQDREGDLDWFWFITAGLLLFGTACYLIAKKVYRIV
ncbi:hypothetical protein VTJ83DRAFT_518 [Remersonia thermophila]|uniref:Uncharacterized protein n=1 Tax=Remersonia thermophila TaxID=72144 RepID=A0ABR4DLD4_9PEZI